MPRMQENAKAEALMDEWEIFSGHLLQPAMLKNQSRYVPREIGKKRLINFAFSSELGANRNGDANARSDSVLV